MKHLAIVALVSCFALHPSYAVTYYVSPTGDDGNSGLFHRPWKTFAASIPKLFGGDTLYIRGGTYQEPIQITRSDAFDYIFIGAYRDEKVIIEGSQYQGVGVSIDAPAIVVQGLEIHHFEEGITVQPERDLISINSCTIRDVQYGITLRTGVHDVVISNCEMYRFGWYGFDATTADNLRPIYNIYLERCYAHDPDYTIPKSNSDRNADGFACGHSNQRDILFQFCRAERTGDGFDLDGTNISASWCEASNTHYGGGGGFKCWGDSVFLVNCLSYGHSNTGIELNQQDWEGAPFKGKPTTTFVINCTSARNNGAQMFIYSDTSKRLNLYNTILVAQSFDTNTPYAMWFYDATARKPLYEGSNNIFYSDLNGQYVVVHDTGYGVAPNELTLANWRSRSGQDSKSMFLSSSDGLFRGLSANDFRLVPGSPAIDAADVTRAPETDFTYQVRDAKPDIGAYEFMGSDVSATSALQMRALRAFPNPAGEAVTLVVSLDHASFAQLTVHDAAGRVVREVANKRLTAGSHAFQLDLTGLPTTLFVTLRTDERQEIVQVRR